MALSFISCFYIEIKTWLVDDWDFITRQKKVVELPAKLTVDQILENFVNHKKQAKSKNAEAVKEGPLLEITTGIKEYFNTMLGSQLLYKFERPQYTKLIKDEANRDKPLSKIYGGVHLCRLFGKF